MCVLETAHRARVRPPSSLQPRRLEDRRPSTLPEFYVDRVARSASVDQGQQDAVRYSGVEIRPYTSITEAASDERLPPAPACAGVYVFAVKRFLSPGRSR